MSKWQKRILSIVLTFGMAASLAIPEAVCAEAAAPGLSGGLYDDSVLQRYTVTVVNGSSKTGQDTYAEGDRITVRAGKAPRGMEFIGWSSSGGGTFDNPWSETTVFNMPAENVTLTANFWSVEVIGYYTVTFDLDGGTLASGLPEDWEQEGDLIKGLAAANDTVRPPAVYRYGYTLKGWDQPFEAIESDITYKAIWTRKGTGLNPKPDAEKPNTEKPEISKPDDQKPSTEKPNTTKPAGYTWEKTESGYNLKAPDGSYVSGWAQVDGKWYYCKSGVMQTGWLPLQSTWYYLKPSGQMATGWQQVGNTWYYFTDSGAMKTGWLQQGNTWYYLKYWGGMATGWQKVGSTWYYLTGSGAMKTGWLQQGNTWYYLKSSGQMATGWQWIDGKCYYFYESGKMAANTTIGGYRVNRSGQWVR